MLVNEFISQVEKDNIISTLLKYYKVGNIRIRYKMMNDYAHYDVDRGILDLSSKYKSIKSRQMKDFLITILHEIRHAMDAKKYGWKKFKHMYEMEMNYQIANDKHQYKDNKYEIEAEEFGQKNWKQWYNKFK
tara:strand:- start:86 stop:481 length:396 start_codon:yes stop_codon:yes gene_type:complete